MKRIFCMGAMVLGLVGLSQVEAAGYAPYNSNSYWNPSHNVSSKYGNAYGNNYGNNWRSSNSNWNSSTYNRYGNWPPVNGNTGITGIPPRNQCVGGNCSNGNCCGPSYNSNVGVYNNLYRGTFNTFTSRPVNSTLPSRYNSDWCGTRPAYRPY